MLSAQHPGADPVAAGERLAEGFHYGEAEAFSALALNPLKSQLNLRKLASG